MSDYVVIDGYKANFNGTFGDAKVTVSPGTITGSGSKKTVSGKAVCVEGDETSGKVSGCPYETKTYPTPGVGALTIGSLASDQKAQKLTVDGKKAILVGSKFNAKFSVITLAKTVPPPPTPTPDPTPEYSGTGSFITYNTLLKSD